MEYIFIICPFVALITCQLIKFLGELIKYKKVNLILTEESSSFRKKFNNYYI